MTRNPEGKRSLALEGVWKAARSADRAYRAADFGAFPVGRVPSRGALATCPNRPFTAIIRCLLWVWLVVALPSSSAAENWPCWRGPRLDGTSHEQGVPVHWSATSNVVWKTALPGVGHASPIVWADRVFTVTALLDTQERALLCLDRRTGEILWRNTVVPATLEKKHSLNSHASSTPATDGQRVYVAFLDRQEMVVAAYDFAGRRKWLARAGLLFVTGGFPDHHILAVRPDGRGNVTDTKIVWRTNKGVAYVPSPISAGDYFLVVSDSGVAHCFEAASGKLLWQERMGEHHASLVSAGGRVYFLNDEGVMNVVAPGPYFVPVARNDLGEKTFASPAISAGQLFLRGDKHLFCIGEIRPAAK